MIKPWFWRHHRLLGLCVPGGALLLFGGCGLSDQQLASIFQSVITTGLTTLVAQAVTTLFTLGAGTS